MKEISIDQFVDMVCNFGLGTPKKIKLWASLRKNENALFEWAEGVASNIFETFKVDRERRIIFYEEYKLP